METWTDDDDVTHNMDGIVAMCFVNVLSRRGPCKNDDPPRTVTCLACVSGDSWDKLFSEMLSRGVDVDQAALRRAREIWELEKIPLRTT
jgi:hypothetical protein